MARAGAVWALGLVLFALGGAAQAQDAAVRKPKRPAPPPRAASAPDTTATPPAGPDVARVQVTPLPGAERLRVGPAVSKAPTLRSAVRSRWSAAATIASRGGGACRAQCASSRLACLAPASDDEAPRCNAAWTGCLSSCADLAYGRAPARQTP